MRNQIAARLGLVAVGLLLVGGIATLVAARHHGRSFVAEPGKIAADFTLLSEAGRPLSLASLHGKAIAMLVMPPDTALDAPTAAAMRELARRSKEAGITLVTVSASSLLNDLGEQPIRLRDHAGDVASLYMVLDRPTVFLIDSAGVIQKRLSVKDAAAQA